MEKTIAELSHDTGIPEATLREAAQKKRLPARKSGDTWLINTADPAFKNYLERRQKWLRQHGRDIGTKDSEE